MSSIGKFLQLSAATVLAVGVSGCTPGDVAEAIVAPIVNEAIVNPLVSDLNLLGTVEFCFDNSTEAGCESPNIFSPNTSCEALGVEEDIIGDLLAINGATGGVCYVYIDTDPTGFVY